jgi:hypothetical protein
VVHKVEERAVLVHLLQHQEHLETYTAEAVEERVQFQHPVVSLYLAVEVEVLWEVQVYSEDRVVLVLA